MSNPITCNALISLSRRFVGAFVAGEKCVELRRRKPDIPRGAYVWFYSKVPDGKIRAFGVVCSVVELNRGDIWTSFGSCLAISRSEFDKYLGDKETAFVIRFSEIREIEVPITLEEVRSLIPNFQPPQFFTYIRSVPLLERLSLSAERSAPVAHAG